MRFIFLIVILFFSFDVRAQSFFSTLPDIPLMDGLEEINDQAFVFDKPQGRILVGMASIDSKISDSQAEHYYARVLPQFGWQKMGDKLYARQNEMLTLEFVEYDLQNRFEKALKITVTP
ncbi:MAG: hypothetical protein AB8B83_05570 [Bdellovibrionales bacterium]